MDNKSVNFIQEVYPSKDWNKEELTVICDCVEGIRGKLCVHAVAQYMRLNLMTRPSQIPKDERFSRGRHGRVPGARRQIRF